MTNSIWYYKKGLFAQLLREFSESDLNKDLTVFKALETFRDKERQAIPKDFVKMPIIQLASNYKLIERLYLTLKKVPPEKQFKLPYKKEDREKEIIELIADTYNVDRKYAQAKIATGFYTSTDGDIAFTYCVEAAIVPFDDGPDGLVVAGEIELICNVNSSITIDGGESYFSKGTFTWKNRKGELQIASGFRDVLSKCGFTTYKSLSRRRVHSVVYLNLLTYVPEWVGGAGKNQITIDPYADLIAKTVSGLAYNIPSYYGHGYRKILDYSGIAKDSDQVQQDYYLNFLRQRYKDIQKNPSLKYSDRITQSGVWYRVHKVMVAKGFRPRIDWGTTRKSLTNSISTYCKKLSKEEWGKTVTREDLGIVASSRAIMYFNGHEYPVSKDNISMLANTDTTDIIVIEKEGMADVLKEYADKYHIALVFTRGRFVEYVKELIQEAISEKIDINVWTLTDYDVDGMEIAEAVDKEKVPRIGIDLNTVTWLQENGSPDLKQEDVEEEHSAKDAKTRTDDKYLWSNRIELDSIHTEVGGKGLWDYIIHQITTLSKKPRDYTNIISRPEPSTLYSTIVNEFLDYLANSYDAVIDERYSEIDSVLAEIKNEVLEVEKKKAFIRKGLKTDIINKDENIKTIDQIIKKLRDSKALPKPKNNFVSEATTTRQKEQADREKEEAETEDDSSDIGIRV